MLSGLILGDLIYLSTAVFGLAVAAHSFTPLLTLINWAALSGSQAGTRQALTINSGIGMMLSCCPDTTSSCPFLALRQPALRVMIVFPLPPAGVENDQYRPFSN